MNLKILGGVIALMVSTASVGFAQQAGPSIASLPKEKNGHYDAAQRFTCTQVHENVCIAYCKANNPTSDCTLDCDERMKECRTLGAYMVRRLSRTYVTNLRRE